jgi:hypothetical protein
MRQQWLQQQQMVLQQPQQGSKLVINIKVEFCDIWSK